MLLQLFAADVLPEREVRPRNPQVLNSVKIPKSHKIADLEKVPGELLIQKETGKLQISREPQVPICPDDRLG